MNKYYDEIEEWFTLLYHQCYIKDNFFYYDENYILKEKIYRISGKNKPEKSYDVKYIIFQQDKENHYFWIKYDGYWKFLMSEYSLNYTQVREITSKVVQKITNCEQYTTIIRQRK